MTHARRAYVTSLEQSAILLRKLKRHRTPDAVAEICEAWVTVGIAGLVDTLGWEGMRDLLRYKLGDTPVPGSTPKLVVDNTAGTAA